MTGEVLYEGDYALTEKSERLSDLIKKAGGVNPFADIKGARFSRRINADERKRMETVLDMAKTGKDSIKSISNSSSSRGLSVLFV